MEGPAREGASAVVLQAGLALGRALCLAVHATGNTMLHRVVSFTVVFTAVLFASGPARSSGNPLVGLLRCLMEGKGLPGVLVCVGCALVQCVAAMAVHVAIDYAAPHVNAARLLECVPQQKLGATMTQETFATAMGIALYGILLKMRMPNLLLPLALSAPHVVYTQPCMNPSTAVAQFLYHRDPQALYAFVMGPLTGATLSMMFVLRVHAWAARPSQGERGDGGEGGDAASGAAKPSAEPAAAAAAKKRKMAKRKA
eukprot:Rhum_TRINITY_DN21471_c0_g1::Rhum_TRINITY_DN21471_c0_g1_i1::g.174119::m.174119